MQLQRLDAIRLLALLTFFIAAFLFNACPVVGKTADSLKCALLRSEINISAQGLRGERQFAGAVNLLRRLGIEPEIISEADIDTLDAELLVLPDVRRMSTETVSSIIKFSSQGGRVLATYQTSFRDENGRGLKDFALSRLFGASFSHWNEKSGDCLLTDQKGIVSRLRLGDSQAMIFNSDCEAIAFWETGTPLAVKNGNCVYAGADLFIPDNSDSLLTSRLITSLIESLFDDGIALREPEISVSSSYDLPPEQIIAEGFPLRIYLGSHNGEVIISSPDGVACGSSDGSLFTDQKLNDKSNEHKPSVVRIAPVASLEGMKAAAYIGDQIIADRELVVTSPGGWLELRRLNDSGTYLSRAYRGKIRIRAGAGLEIANIVDIEEYLAGNVPSEVPSWFESEAIKAMSCVARTYALSHLGAHEDKGCDLCDTVHCQVYNGLADESDKITALIKETKGNVLYQDGKPASCLFHAVCGGSTDEASSVWGNWQDDASCGIPADSFFFISKPKDISDNSSSAGFTQRAEKKTDVFASFIDNPPPCFCDKASRFRWEKEISADELSSLLKKSLPVLLNCNSGDVGNLKDICILKRTPGGRVAEMLIKTDKKSFRLGGDKVRWMTSGGKIGSSGLNSSLFNVKCEGGTIRFQGGGWGHGIGLCQEGAQGRAMAGSSYAEILEAYFPLCRLSNIRQLKRNKL